MIEYIAFTQIFLMPCVFKSLVYITNDFIIISTIQDLLFQISKPPRFNLILNCNLILINQAFAPQQHFTLSSVLYLSYYDKRDYLNEVSQ